MFAALPPNALIRSPMKTTFPSLTVLPPKCNKLSGSRFLPLTISKSNVPPKLKCKKKDEEALQSKDVQGSESLYDENADYFNPSELKKELEDCKFTPQQADKIAKVLKHNQEIILRLTHSAMIKAMKVDDIRYAAYIAAKQVDELTQLTPKNVNTSLGVIVYMITIWRELLWPTFEMIRDIGQKKKGDPKTAEQNKEK